MKKLSFVLTAASLLLLLLFTTSCEKARLNKLQKRLDNGETPCQLLDAGEDYNEIIGLYYAGGILTVGGSDGTNPCSFTVIHNQDIGAHEWGCVGTNVGAIPTTADNSATLTAKILAANCADDSPAARLCDAYTLSDATGDYENWLLPSLEAMQFLSNNVIQGRNYLTIDGLPEYDFGAYEYYWTSREVNADSAYAFRINGTDSNDFKVFHKSEQLGLVPARIEF